MNKQERADEARRFIAFTALPGFTHEEYDGLRRSAMTLHRWYEAECNGDVQQDEKTGKWFRHYGHNGLGPFLTVKTADKEKGALKRINDICRRHGLTVEIQSDPRGAPVKIGMPLEDKREFYFS